MTLPAALLELAQGCPREPLPSTCVAFMRANGVPEDIIVTLTSCAFAGDLRLGSLRLSRLAEADRENAQSHNAPCIENGFLIVGSSLTGDPIALELRTGNLAFVSHDVLWENDYEVFEEVVVRSPLKFEEFWLAALTDPQFPRDSYEATKKWTKPHRPRRTPR